MNSLSWFLYLCDILGNIQKACFIIVTIGGFGGGVVTAILWGNWSDYSDSMKKPTRFTTWWLLFIVFISIFTSLIPSKQTMYMIAASEAVQRAALNTAEGQEMI